jgi:uncharacterized RDD family membrane protein YckC
MSIIRIATSFNIDVEFPAAPFHRRLFAWLLDIVAVVLYALTMLKMFDSFTPSGSNKETTDALMILFIYIPIVLYHFLCEVIFKGQSIGKRILQLKVINEYGGRPSVSQVAIRWIIRTSDLMVFAIVLNLMVPSVQNVQYLWSLGITFALFVTDIILVSVSPRQQRLGDILAHTMMIRTRQKAGIHDTIFLAVQDAYKPTFPQVMQLSDRDINALKSILDTAIKKHDYYLADRAAIKIKAHLHIETSLSAFDFLETLLKDYNYLSAH